MIFQNFYLFICNMFKIQAVYSQKEIKFIDAQQSMEQVFDSLVQVKVEKFYDSP